MVCFKSLNLTFGKNDFAIKIRVIDTKDIKVSFYLKKSEANELGECPVMACLTIGKYSEAAFSAKMRSVGIVMVIRPGNGEKCQNP